MRILITNECLAVRAGTESFVRDLARGLQELGHSVMAFSSDPGRVARLLERDLIPVTTDPGNLPVFPDIIHARHHLDAMAAVTALPGVPAIYQEYGGLWQEHPPQHPRIYHYLAASGELAETMQAHSGIDPAHISTFLHPVDTSRFLEVRKLPAVATKALLVNSRHPATSAVILEARSAAAQCGLRLDLGGREFAAGGQGTENILPEYDIVFASGPCAVEALACGCAVVVAGPDGFGEMVSPANFDRLRQSDFSLARDVPGTPFTQMELVVRNYAPETGAGLAERARGEGDMAHAVGRLVGIYGQVIQRHRQSRVDLSAEASALSSYLKGIGKGVLHINTNVGGKWPLQVCWRPFDFSAPKDMAPHL